MIRAFATLFVATLLVIVLGIPLLLTGLVYPSRRACAFIAVLWSRAILVVSGLRLEIAGGGQVADGAPRFFVGNHQSAMDIPVLIVALRGRVRFMAKKALFHIPVFGWVIRRFGHVPIERSTPRAAMKVLKSLVERLARNPISFVLFPEGTRSVDGRLLPFRRGAMKICQRAGLDIVPFSIDGSLAVHRRAEFRIHPGLVRLRFGQSIPAEEVAKMSGADLHDRVKEAIVRGVQDAHDPLTRGSNQSAGECVR